MSMEDYLWDIEERVEDAIVAHIKAMCSEVAQVQAARQVTTAAYPLVVVSAEDSDNHNDTGRFTGIRRMDVSIAIITEAMNYLGDTGSIEALRQAREHHRIIKSAVIGAIAGNEVHTDLNNRQPEGVVFSQAYCTRQTRDAGDGKLVTIQTLDVIAGVKEL